MELSIIWKGKSSYSRPGVELLAGSCIGKWRGEIFHGKCNNQCTRQNIDWVLLISGWDPSCIPRFYTSSLKVTPGLVCSIQFDHFPSLLTHPIISSWLGWLSPTRFPSSGLNQFIVARLNLSIFNLSSLLLNLVCSWLDSSSLWFSSVWWIEHFYYQFILTPNPR